MTRLRSLARRRLAGLLLALLFVLGLPRVSLGTWSIVAYDSSTGEIAIGCATCLTDFDLEEWVPVMLIGVGGACAQSRIDGAANNRVIIWDELQKGTHPRDILKIIRDRDSVYAWRQFGIVDAQGRRGTHTGVRCGTWAGDVRGKEGTISYAIQGNVLTGEPVILQARDALLSTPGDLSEKLMAAMEAAYSMGGDGRCSCGDPPDSCGSPPPSFTKSAHVGFMLVGRMGDVDGICNSTLGCANGDYYMNLNVAHQTQFDPDPVLQLRLLFDSWRDLLRGRPDHILTQKSFTDDAVPGNGTAATTLDIAPLDWEGNGVGAGLQISVRHAESSAGLAEIGTPADNGDGTYSVLMTAGAGQGVDQFEVMVDDGQDEVLLYPFPELTHTDTLHADLGDLSSGAGGIVNLALEGPEDPFGRGYLVLASASGTEPGFDLYGVHVPLNVDPVLAYSFALRNGSIFVNTDGQLAPDGTGAAQFVAVPGLLDALVGGQLAFAYLATGPTDFASNPAVVTISN